MRTLRDPVAHRLVDRFLQRGRAGRHGHDLRAEEPHARDVERLPLHVHRAHVDDAFAAEARRHRGRGDAVLARAGLGDDALLAHAPREQNLAERVVDLVRAGVEQVLALEIDFRAAEFLGQAFGEVERRGPSGEVLQQRGEFRLERGVAAGAFVFVGEVAQRSHERLGHEHAAVGAEVAVGVGEGLHEDQGIGCQERKPENASDKQSRRSRRSRKLKCGSSLSGTDVDPRSIEPHGPPAGAGRPSRRSPTSPTDTTPVFRPARGEGPPDTRAT